MNNDVEIILNMLDRIVDNLIEGTTFCWFGDAIKQFVHNKALPYLTLFSDNDGTFRVDVAASYLKKKTEDEIRIFRKEFELDEEKGK